MAQRILVADDDPVLRSLLSTLLQKHGFDVITVPNGDALVRAARELLPDLLLVDVIMPVMDGLEAVRQLRQDTRTSHLPMLLITAQSGSRQAVQGFESGADDYLTKPFDNDLLVARVKANLRRAARTPVNNPLTGLPGNVLIAEEAHYRLRNHRPFALLWIDIDNFKSLNDAYGFARGDRAIKLLGDLLAALKQERGDPEDFAGHIGGDDFVLLASPEAAAEIGEWIIKRFDESILELYDPADVRRGYLTQLDRFGTSRRFPLISVSIGIVDTRRRVFSSYEEVSVIAAEVKRFAKKQGGSSYAFDERRQETPVPKVERRGRPPLATFACGDDALCARLRHIAEQAGVRTGVRAPRELRATLLSERPDLIVIEAHLPGAWELLADLRGVAPKLPIIMVLGDPAGDNRAIAAGASAALPNTVGAEQFMATLAQLLRLNQSTQPGELLA